MVTAEVAVALPVLVLVLAISLSAISLGVDSVRCQDAARVAVRDLARGESAGRAHSDAQAALPHGSQVSSSRSGERVTVTVLTPSPSLLRGLGIHEGARCSATARVEEIEG